MYSYVTEELPKTVFEAFKELDPTRVSITGHSMGGHGALTLVRTYTSNIFTLTQPLYDWYQLNLYSL
jgi:S-formylglutathione hydrolase FrmB